MSDPRFSLRARVCCFVVLLSVRDFFVVAVYLQN